MTITSHRILYRLALIVQLALGVIAASSIATSQPYAIAAICYLVIGAPLFGYAIHVYIERQRLQQVKLTAQLRIVLVKLHEYLQREQPRQLYVSAQLFELLRLEKQHQPQLHYVYNWRYAQQQYTTAIIIDEQLQYLQFSIDSSATIIKTIQDVYAL